MSKKSITNNYIAIQGWMVEQLGLKGNELLAYALIHGDEYHEGYLQSTADDNHRYRQNLQNYLTNQTYLQPLTETQPTNITLL